MYFLMKVFRKIDVKQHQLIFFFFLGFYLFI